MSQRSAHGLTRRTALQFGVGAGLAIGLKPYAWAAGKDDLHALSVFGEFKYPPDFKHFDYLNPDAPKGGRMVFQPPNWSTNQSTQTFNTLNSYVLKGDSPPRMGFLFDTLMAGSADEPDTMYGLVAKTFAVSEDANVFTFALRPEARFHDGSKLTAEDAAFSFMLLKEKGHPVISQPIAEMVSAIANGPQTVVVTLSGKQNRQTILTIASLPIFSKAYYSKQDFEASTLEPPLGSGPYKVGAFSAGRFIEFARVPDYWGKDLPVNVGTSNFDIIRIDFYRERQTAFEAFKKGEITVREEFTSRTWATEYNFPAVTEGRVKQSYFPAEAVPAMQGWYYNSRRSKFGDPRTRKALGLAFDFEWTNRNVFYGAYSRIASYFQKSDFMAAGPPSADELKLLEPHRGDLPPEVFGEPYVPPKSDGSGRDRSLLRQASTLLQQAGWTQKGATLVDKDGQSLSVEFLIEAEAFIPALSPFIENLKVIGVPATIRQVDPSQYQARLNNFDYDIIGAALSFSATPLDGMNEVFGSKAADVPGSYNRSGIKDKTVDALLAKLRGVTSREELVAILRAMDRVLRAKHYWISNWYSPNHRVAHWNIFAWPEVKPDYGFSAETTWWLDQKLAAAAGKPNG